MAYPKNHSGIVRFNDANTMKLNKVLGGGGVGFSAIGTALEGITNGITEGFVQRFLVAELTSTNKIVMVQKVAASAGSDLATPVNYFIPEKGFRIRVGSTTAAGVPATSGCYDYVSQNTNARGVLRFGLADVDDAAQMILDQNGVFTVNNLVDWELNVAISYWANQIDAATYFDVGLASTAVPVDPASAFATNFVKFRLANGYATMSNQSATLGSYQPGSGEFVLSFVYSAKTRQVSGYVNGQHVGTSSVATAVTAYQIGMRACHVTAYTTLANSPITVDVDSIMFTCSSPTNPTV